MTLTWCGKSDLSDSMHVSYEGKFEQEDSKGLETIEDTLHNR